MTTTCSGCGALAQAEARFCRHCGTALRATGTAGGETVSPLASTIPLAPTDIITGELADQQPHTTDQHQLGQSSAQLHDDGGEITIPVIRSATTKETEQVAEAARAQIVNAPPPARAARPAKRRGGRLWVTVGLVAIVLLLCVGGTAAWFKWRAARRAPAVVANANMSLPSAPPDAKQQAQAKLAEAQRLLSAGDMVGATARLREALALDPENVEAHRQLAQLLLESGAHQTAIEELRAITRLEPNDTVAWRQLAAAQFAAGLYADAAESYRTLTSISDEARADDRLQLAYADALRLAGRTMEAASIYRSLLTSPLPDVARTSSQRYQDIVAPPVKGETAAHSQGANEAPNAQPTPTRATTNVTAQPHPSPANPTKLSPAAHYQRGVNLWATDRTAAAAEFRAATADGNPDAYYYLGLSFAEGRDPHTLSRAELVAALEYFQRARNSHFSAQARRYEDQLGQEFDRRHKKP